VRGGWIAVPLFFVLSAMLLYLPFVRAGLSGGARPDARYLYQRRLLRIAPLYYVSMLAYLVAHAAWQRPQPSVGELFRHLLFLQNLQHDFSIINAPYWSLAVEVQFYLLTPLLGLGLYSLLRAVRFRIALGAAALFALVPLAYRLYVVAHPALLHEFGYAQLIYCSPISNFDSFAFGVIGAIVYGRSLHERRPLFRPSTAHAVFVLSFLFLYWIMRVDPDLVHHEQAPATWFAPAIHYSLINLGWCICILSSLSLGGGVVWNLFRSRFVQLTSRLSYGLYIWTVLCIDATRGVYRHFGIVRGHRAMPVILCTQLALTFGVAAVSYRWIELPFLKRKRRS